MDINPNRTPEVMIEEKLPVPRNSILAFQHVLLMNAYVVPVILATTLGFDSARSTAIIQSTFLASGITTLLQAKYFMKYPVVYGASFVPVGAIVGIYLVNGGTPDAWEVVVGASLVGAIAVLLLGLTKTYNKILDYLISPVVGATIVLCIGLSLIPLALTSQVFVENGLTIGENIMVAVVTMATMIIFSLIGNKEGKFATVSRISSGIFALIVGSIFASFFGNIDMSAVGASSLISRPALPFVDFGIQLDISSILTMIVLYFVLMTETTGTWLATSSATQTQLTEERVNSGVIGLGVSNIISALFGSPPQSGYSSNVGILALTDTYSRHVFSYVGLILIIIGFSAKLSALIAVIPSAAIGGIFLLTSGAITVAGINMCKGLEMNSKESYIISISVIVSIALNIIPADALQNLPVVAQYILGSSIASSALVAIILNKLIRDPKPKIESVR